MNFDLLEKRVEQRSLQVVLNAHKLDLPYLYDKFKVLGYKLYLSPSLDELERRTVEGKRIVLLLPSLSDGYLTVIGEKRLKAIILTLSKAITSKLGPYVF